MKKNFLDRVKEETEKYKSINSDDTLEFYQVAVSELYENVSEWIELKKNRDWIKTEKRIKDLSEEEVGSYEIESLELTFGNMKTIVFNPEGCQVTSGFGLVEVYLKGFRTQPILLSLQKDVKKPVWFLHHFRPSMAISDEYRLLNQSTFEWAMSKLLQL